MPKKKTKVMEAPEATTKRESLAKRQQNLDALFEEASAKCGVIAGRPTKSKAVMDRMTFKFFATPVAAVNEALGGGLAVGRNILISGGEDTGKTGFCLATIGYQMQLDPNFIALWVESEDSLDVEKASSLYHIDLDRFYCLSTRDPDTKKQVFGAEAIGNLIMKAIRETDVDICVINSLKMLVPMAEATKNFEDDTMAVQARFNSKFMKKAVPLCAQRNTTMVLVQHYTTNMNAGMYGNQLAA